MPTYTYECHECRRSMDADRRIDSRHKDAPVCPTCDLHMWLVVSPVAGVVRDPAVPRGKP